MVTWGNPAHVTTLARLTVVPSRIIAGDSVEMTLTPSDFRASDGGTLTFALAGAVSLSVAGVVNSDAWDVTLTAEQTGNLTAGSYQYSVRVVEGAYTKTVETGVLVADYSASTSRSTDLQYWEDTITACRTARTNILAGEMKMLMIQGRQVMFHSLAEVDQLESKAHAMLDMLRRGSVFGSVRVQFAR